MSIGGQQGSTIRHNDPNTPPLSMLACIGRLALPKRARPPHLTAILIAALALSGPTEIGHAEPLKDSAVNAGPASRAKAPNGVSADWWRCL